MLSREKVGHRPVVTKLWIDGRASEDRDEWTEEARAHCERCYDDKAETPEVQAEKNPRQKVSGDGRAAHQGHRTQITVNRVLRRGKMMKNKANGHADCCMTEMLQFLPTVTVYEVAHRFDKRLKGECRTPEAWKILRLVSLKKPDAKLEKGLRAIALLSVFFEMYTTVLWIYYTRRRSRLNGGICTWEPRGINCEHMQPQLQMCSRDTGNGRKTVFGGPRASRTARRKSILDASATVV